MDRAPGHLLEGGPPGEGGGAGQWRLEGVGTLQGLQSRRVGGWVGGWVDGWWVHSSKR